MHPIIDELMNRWEESRERGQLLTPEQLCEEHPEFLEELTWQIKALKAVEAHFGDAGVEGTQPFPSGANSTKQHQTVRVTSEFHIDRLHASGGLGEVYLAKDAGLHRTVAIKFPRADRLSKSQLLRFEREAQITGRLNHPGIVPVHALKGEDSQQPCYVMRFVDGPTLQERIDQLFVKPEFASEDLYTSLEFRQLLQNFVSLCNIVAYAHQQGIIHRDIKPSNIILGPYGETLLMDWGLAKSVAETESQAEVLATSDSVDTVVEVTLRTHTGQFVGTPAFASPEQRNGQLNVVDQRSDIYSLGATLLAMLTGNLPGSDWTQRGTLTNRLGDVVPHRLAEICRKAIAEKFALRYASVGQFREDIERYLAGEPISVIPETAWSRLSRLVRKKSGWTAGILVAVSLTVLAVGIGGLILSYKNRQLQESNRSLALANAASLAAQQRSAATTQLLTRSLRAATPEVTQGKERSIRELLDETALQLKNDKAILPLVAADTHKVLAAAYISLGDYEQAQEHADASYLIYSGQLGENSDSALDAQSTIALTLSRRDQDEEAIRVARDALQRGRASKEIDPKTMAVLLDVCGLTLSNGNSPAFEESLSLHREAYDLARQYLDPEDATALSIFSDYGVALMDAGELDEGERVLKEAKEAHERILGPLHPDTLVDVFNLIALNYNEGNLQAALDMIDAYQEIFENVFGLDHERNIRILHILSMTGFRMSNFDDAEDAARIALERSSRAFGLVHQHTLMSRGLLCGAMIAQSKFDEAARLADEQYQLTKAEYGESHSATFQAMTLFLDMAEARKDLDAMEYWVEKLQGSQWGDAARETLEAARKSLSSVDDEAEKKREN